MAMSVYIQPVGLVESPQAAGQGAVRLGGSLAYADRFALIVRDGRQIVSRALHGAGDMAGAIAALPDALASEAQVQWRDLARPAAPLVGGAIRLPLDQPRVMGILNVTPDSFSDGGLFDDPAAAVDQALAMAAAGATVIDIGGESTRPGAAPVWEGDEIRRVVPVIERLAACGTLLSIDSRRASVIGAALSAGAQIVNDVSAMRHDPATMDLVAEAGVPVVLMHAPGEVSDIHGHDGYAHVVFDVFDALRERRDAALAAGIARERIMIDPGIGFGKSLTENCALVNALPLFHALGQPILFAASRKRMIAALAGEAAADHRLGGSLMLAAEAVRAGAHMVRAHDVAETVQALGVWRGLRDAALSDFTLMGEV